VRAVVPGAFQEFVIAVVVPHEINNHAENKLNKINFFIKEQIIEYTHAFQ
jgi:hypothetical protein